ncbi:hypothetical protein HPB48_006930 [Haemaphysalis longicornis]|uniref:CCHC-type domain-containing protein n=1 Tax=Haemaphysalis longicornis TaxID=44386 RepID=A0A9J6GE46_HAELO|nr:hypothetical protein HPB48_006930 [Haemaphysalis longicornis]
MAQHAMAAMPTHAFPGFVAASPSEKNPTARIGGAPLRNNVTARATTNGQKHRHLSRFPPRLSRNQSGQPWCYTCGRTGHMMRQCDKPPREDRAPSYRQGRGT